MQPNPAGEEVRHGSQSRQSGWGPRRWATCGLVVLLLAASAYFGWTGYRDFPLRELPDVDLTAASPPVRTAITQARRDVIGAPRSGRAWGNLGLYLEAHEFLTEAEICFARAMRFDPREVLWPYLRGSVLSIRDRPEAERCFRRAAEVRPDLALPRVRLGELYLEQRLLESARTEFQTALDIDADDARAALGLARVAFTEGHFEESRRWAERSFERDNQQRTTAELLVRIYHRIGDEKSAVRLQREGDRLPSGEARWDDPLAERMFSMRRDPSGLAQRADDLIAEGRYSDAIRMLNQLIALAPETTQWPLMLSRTLIHVHDYPRAAAVLDTASARHPDSADLQFQRGVVHLLVHEWAEGAERLRRATELKPNFSDAWYDLGQGLKHLQQRDQAVDAFREAIRFRPDYAAAHLSLGELLLDAGQTEAAREALEIAARLDPDNHAVRQQLNRLR